MIYVPPPAGGLFLDAGAIDDITGGPFLIDHDQKLQLQTGIFYDIGATGVWLGTNVRYDSGLVSGAAPEDPLGDPDNQFAIPYIDTVTMRNGISIRIGSRRGPSWIFRWVADLTQLSRADNGSSSWS